MTTMQALDLAIFLLVLAIIYSVFMTMWKFCPQVLIRWADYFGIRIKDKPLETLVQISAEEEKQIEVEEIHRR